ncbi:hypothetical protein DSM3645_20142 [Blastopirellula marina DSM 3645]|uniref:Uncharacterized protein n=1 Tax=Blastopirellula marina DSM 3645 TaxID=314230 RepID=A4A1B7_9BACT|nr:hypothetical protein DSM3645_20142 [Blastopirellula marina DSM 3645]
MEHDRNQAKRHNTSPQRQRGNAFGYFQRYRHRQAFPFNTVARWRCGLVSSLVRTVHSEKNRSGPVRRSVQKKTTRGPVHIAKSVTKFESGGRAHRAAIGRVSHAPLHHAHRCDSLQSERAVPL